MKALLTIILALTSTVILSQVTFERVYALEINEDTTEHKIVELREVQGSIEHQVIGADNTVQFLITYDLTPKEEVVVPVTDSYTYPDYVTYYSAGKSWKVLVEADTKNTWVYYNYDEEREMYYSSLYFIMKTNTP